jgi:hypothetical protein
MMVMIMYVKAYFTSVHVLDHYISVNMTELNFITTDVLL